MIFRALFFRANAEFGQKCIVGQPPRVMYGIGSDTSPMAMGRQYDIKDR